MLGFIRMYPEGIGSININDIYITFQDIPTEISQFYFIKLVDTDWKNRDKPFSLEFDSKEEDGIYSNAVLSTPLFTLKAPKIKIKETASRVKVFILSRVKE